MANDIPADSSGSLGGLSLSDEDLNDDEALQSDTWIEELECALLADCDPATLKKICEGKRIPASLRPDYWRTLLALNDAGKVKLASEYDLPNQDELRHDCEQLVEEISTFLAPEPLPESEKLRLKSDFESTLTTYVKARPELHYVSGNGWTDILKVLYSLELNVTQLYQMFFRIVDRYIPRDLSTPPQSPTPSRKRQDPSARLAKDKSNEASNNTKSDNQTSARQASDTKQQSAISAKAATASKQSQQTTTNENINKEASREKSIQGYHLLRLLIQYHDPELCSILDSKKVTPRLYAKDWLCSLFARSCPPKLALHMWDMHFKMADPFLIFFAAIVMVVNASDELKRSNLSQADMLSALKKMPGLLEEGDVEDLYYLVSNHYTNSTPRSIRSYSHLFFLDTFGATYMGGSESPELDGSSSMIDSNTCRLTSSLDLSQYLCLPIVPAEIFALETVAQRSSPTESRSSHHSDGSPSSTSPQQAANQALRYFLVDCRPAEQYNAGHLTKAFHLDCSLMLREPSSFATAVQALLEIQRQVVASKSNTGGQHLCFIGSGQDEEDRYVNMVVASFLQKYQKYVGIVYGGFDAIHDYVKSKRELKDSFDKYIVDHNDELCKTCCSQSPEAFERFKANAAAAAASKQRQQQGSSIGQALLATTAGFFKGDKNAASSALSKFTASNPQATATAQQLAQSGASIFDKFTTAFVSKSSVFKDRLVETLNNTSLPTATISSAGALGSQRGHVSSQDRLGPRYTGGSYRFDQLSADPLSKGQDDTVGEIEEGPCQEIQIDQWQRENDIMALHKCVQIRGTLKYPGFIGINRSHLWILREIPHNKGFASIAAKRPLDMVVQVTSKRRQPDLIIFRYGYANNATKSPQGQSAEQGQPQGVVQTQPAGTNVQQEQQQQQLNKGLPTIIATDQLQIPQAFEVIRLIKREIVRIMDETARRKAEATATPAANDEPAVNGAEVSGENGHKIQEEGSVGEAAPSETATDERPASEATGESGEHSAKGEMLPADLGDQEHAEKVSDQLEVADQTDGQPKLEQISTQTEAAEGEEDKKDSPEQADDTKREPPAVT